MTAFLQASAVPDDLRCKYPSKRCDHPRVLKRDGDLHRFCEFHRLKANQNQQRLEQRRRSMTSSSPRTAANPTTPRRNKRNLKITASVSSPASEFESELPALDVGDLDLDLLGGLLDMPLGDALDDVDNTQAALWLLEESTSSNFVHF